MDWIIVQLTVYYLFPPFYPVLSKQFLKDDRMDLREILRIVV